MKIILIALISIGLINSDNDFFEMLGFLSLIFIFLYLAIWLCMSWLNKLLGVDTSPTYHNHSTNIQSSPITLAYDEQSLNQVSTSIQNFRSSIPQLDDHHLQRLIHLENMLLELIDNCKAHPQHSRMSQMIHQVVAKILARLNQISQLDAAAQLNTAHDQDDTHLELDQQLTQLIEETLHESSIIFKQSLQMMTDHHSFLQQNLNTKPDFTSIKNE